MICSFGKDISGDEEIFHIRENEGMFKWLENCIKFYDWRILLLIAMQYINEGGTLMLTLSCTLYFLKQHEEPVTATYYMCLISLPEALSFFWGMISDSME